MRFEISSSENITMNFDSSYEIIALPYKLSKQSQ